MPGMGSSGKDEPLKGMKCRILFANILVDDRLQMNAKGYAVWREAVAPLLETGEHAFVE